MSSWKVYLPASSRAGRAASRARLFDEAKKVVVRDALEAKKKSLGSKKKAVVRDALEAKKKSLGSKKKAVVVPAESDEDAWNSESDHHDDDDGNDGAASLSSDGSVSSTTSTVNSDNWVVEDDDKARLKKKLKWGPNWRDEYPRWAEMDKAERRHAAAHRGFAQDLPSRKVMFFKYIEGLRGRKNGSWEKFAARILDVFEHKLASVRSALWSDQLVALLDTTPIFAYGGGGVGEVDDLECLACDQVGRFVAPGPMR